MGNVALTPEQANQITSLYRAGKYWQIAFQETNGTPGIQLEEFYSIDVEGESQPLSERDIDYIKSLQHWLITTAEPSTRHAIEYPAFIATSAFYVTGESFPGREIAVSEWLANPDGVIKEAWNQTDGSILGLKKMLNIADYCTRTLDQRVVLYAGIGVRGVDEIPPAQKHLTPYTIITPLLQTNFDVLVGVELIPLSYEKFQRLTSEQLGIIVDPNTGNKVGDTLQFREITTNQYEATFTYLGKERTIKAFFETDVNSDKYSREGINIVYDDTGGAISLEVLTGIFSALDDKGILIGTPVDYGYVDPQGGQHRDRREYVKQNFTSVNSPGFFELVQSSDDLICRGECERNPGNSPYQHLILQKRTPKK